ncbi:MAG TPA: disulfide reductase [Deltaproteobacteria bacterium]|nr:disulfide reductase [Deltaproteobacteria bacterium]
MKIPYYPGCTLNSYARHFDMAAREASRRVGFEMAELLQWNCCGATFPLTPDNVMGLTAPVKVLANARSDGAGELVTLCSVCYNVLKRTNKVMREDRERRDIVNGFIEESYDGGLDVLHYFEVLRDRVGFERVKEAVTLPLKGLRAAAYYGCMLLRPFEDMGIDDAEAPTVFEDLLAAMGAEPVSFSNRIECCGAHQAMEREAIVVKLSGRVLTQAAELGAEVVVTSCPLCQYNLEKSQKKVAEQTPGFTPMPVVYFTQLLALSVGVAGEDLGLEHNAWDARPLLREKGVL